jgi:hypothetical protein
MHWSVRGKLIVKEDHSGREWKTWSSPLGFDVMGIYASGQVQIKYVRGSPKSSHSGLQLVVVNYSCPHIGIHTSTTAAAATSSL